MTTTTEIPTLRMAVKRYPTNEALLNGTVTSSNLKLEFNEVEPIHNAFAPMAQRQVYDLSEMAIFTYLQAYTYGKPIVLMPLVMAARHQHQHAEDTQAVESLHQQNGPELVDAHAFHRFCAP